MLKKNSTKIHFDKKMANNSGWGFLLYTKFYNIPNGAEILGPNKWKTLRKKDMCPEGKAANKQEKITTKQQAARKIHVKKLHTNIFHPVKYRMYATEEYLDYIVKGTLEV